MSKLEDRNSGDQISEESYWRTFDASSYPLYGKASECRDFLRKISDRIVYDVCSWYDDLEIEGDSLIFKIYGLPPASFIRERDGPDVRRCIRDFEERLRDFVSYSIPWMGFSVYVDVNWNADSQVVITVTDRKRQGRIEQALRIEECKRWRGEREVLEAWRATWAPCAEEVIEKKPIEEDRGGGDVTQVMRETVDCVQRGTMEAIRVIVGEGVEVIGGFAGMAMDLRKIMIPSSFMAILSVGFVLAGDGALTRLTGRNMGYELGVYTGVYDDSSGACDSIDVPWRWSCRNMDDVSNGLVLQSPYMYGVEGCSFVSFGEVMRINALVYLDSEEESHHIVFWNLFCNGDWRFYGLPGDPSPGDILEDNFPKLYSEL